MDWTEICRLAGGCFPALGDKWCEQMNYKKGLQILELEWNIQK